MRNFSGIYILFLFVTFCCSYYDVSFVQFYLHSEFLLNLVQHLCQASAKVRQKQCVTRKSTRNTRNTRCDTTRNTPFAGFLGELYRVPRATLHLKGNTYFLKKCSVARITRCDSPQKNDEFGVTRGVTRVTRCNSRLKYKIKRQHPFPNQENLQRQYEEYEAYL